MCVRVVFLLRSMSQPHLKASLYHWHFFKRLTDRRSIHLSKDVLRAEWQPDAALNQIATLSLFTCQESLHFLERLLIWSHYSTSIALPWICLDALGVPSCIQHILLQPPEVIFKSQHIGYNCLNIIQPHLLEVPFGTLFTQEMSLRWEREIIKVDLSVM